jgi:hypothetical protein
MKTDRLKPTGTRTAEQSHLHISRRPMTTSTVASPTLGGGDSAGDLPTARPPAAAGPVRSPLPEACPGEPVPIWLAVLFATSCKAQRDGKNHVVRWNWVSGRALYTNAGRDAEHIEPLGVSLLGGHTMAVYWMAGDTTYTVEVYRQKELCA